MRPNNQEISEDNYSSSEDDYYVSEDDSFSEDDLLNFAMEKKWDEVVEIYRKYDKSHKIKLTKSGETALHISISFYSSKQNPNHFNQIEQMIDCIEKSGRLMRVLSMKNVRGDNPLHLAAGVGGEAICHLIVSKNPDLISCRNLYGETPLFIAVQKGKVQTVLCFYEYLCRWYGDEEAVEAHLKSLGRRRDGNTILHSAISGEYFELAHQIISYCPKLISCVNVYGETPLHILAKKPNVFKCNSQLGFYDSIIYHGVFVDELKQQKYNPRATPSSEVNLPQNYITCVNIFFFLWTPIYKSFLAGFPWLKKKNAGQSDEENQHLRENKSQKEKSNDNSTFPPNYATKGKSNVFPPNYTTCISLFKFAIKVIQAIAAAGYWRIKKIKEIKEQHSFVFQIMSKMIEYDSRYKYKFNGQCPTQMKSRLLVSPEIPPKVYEFNSHQIKETIFARTSDEHDAHNVKETYSIGRTSSTIAQLENGKDHNKSGERAPSPSNLIFDTPILVAIKDGIPQMVMKIMSRCPVATQDLDCHGENVLMLAAEYRQTSIFDYLLMILPEYMFYQLDKDGNNALHLAGKLDEVQSWRARGATLQMQSDTKWYEHVKSLVPPVCLVQQNTKSMTPDKIFTESHAQLVKEGKEWLIKTSESCSVVAALIATVAFATSATVPGGLNQETGHPILQNHTAFDIFSITSILALSLSITALILFLSIIASRWEERRFKVILPRKLLMGLTSLFASIAAMLVSFCAAHAFILRDELRAAAVPIYTVATLPVTFFAIYHLPFYFDLLWSALRVPSGQVTSPKRHGQLSRKFYQ